MHFIKSIINQEIEEAPDWGTRPSSLNISDSTGVLFYIQDILYWQDAWGADDDNEDDEDREGSV